MTREEAIDYLEWIRPKKPYTQDKKNVQEAIDMGIEALKETERNPTITSWHDFDRGYNIAKEKFNRPHGEWIDVNGDGSLWKCSNCNEKSCCRGNFCSDCGSDNRPLKHDCCFADETCNKNPCADCGLIEGEKK